MTQAIIKKWWKENRCFLSIHKAFNFSMYSNLSLSISLSVLLSKVRPSCEYLISNPTGHTYEASMKHVLSMMK